MMSSIVAICNLRCENREGVVSKNLVVLIKFLFICLHEATCVLDLKMTEISLLRNI